MDAGAVILDSRGRLDFLSGHLPGAQRVDWRIGVTGSLRTGALGPPALAAHDFAALGVDAARPVLVVGAWAHGWGEEGRIAWDLWGGAPGRAWARRQLTVWERVQSAREEEG